MLKLKSLFTIEQGETVTEKRLCKVLTASVISILICIGCLVSTTWAWFSVTVVSEGNMIEVGTAEFRITVNDQDYPAPLQKDETYAMGIYHEGTARCNYQIQFLIGDTEIGSFISSAVPRSWEGASEETPDYLIYLHLKADGVSVNVIPVWGVFETTVPSGSTVSVDATHIIVNQEKELEPTLSTNPSTEETESSDLTQPTEESTIPETTQDPSESSEAEPQK